MPRLLLGLVFCSAIVLGQTPSVQNNGVIDAASLTAGQPVSPGSLVAIMGTGLAASTAQADSIPLSTTLSDASVTINGIPAPLTYVSGAQINAQVPWEVQPGTANVMVSRPSGASQSALVQVVSATPAVYAYPPGDGRHLAVAVAQSGDNFQFAWPVNAVPSLTTVPVTRGQLLVIYANGLGSVDPPATTGDKTGLAVLSKAVNPLTVLVGGVPVQPDFAGLSQVYVGVNQINIIVPQNAPTGSSVPLQISMGGVTSSDQVTIAVQ